MGHTKEPLHLAKPKIPDALEMPDPFETDFQEGDLLSQKRIQNCRIDQLVCDRLSLAQLIFQNVTFQDVALRNVDMADVRFINCNLSNVDFSDAILHRVEDLAGAIVTPEQAVFLSKKMGLVILP